ncbi:MAG: hypothetical protein JSW73_01895 [Candidatus Woesearchaeota archaeon]|nr:MAG: hypothetical protein JSW73_01895 [Candidatus Woesearchaeota archaeon]
MNKNIKEYILIIVISILISISIFYIYFEYFGPTGSIHSGHLTKEQQKEIEARSTAVYIVSQNYENYILSLNIKNIGQRSISLANDNIIMVLEKYNKPQFSMCPANYLSSEYFRCIDGCIEDYLEPDKKTTLNINISNCGTLISGEEYYYQLRFEKGIISGSFKHE